MPPETVASLLATARRLLAEAGSETVALDARVLLETVSGLSHADIVAEPGRLIEDAVAQDFQAAVARRCTGEPVSKIIGFREFYGRRFSVNRSVLDPRPDTEALIDLCLEQFRADAALSFLDLGSGSGAIGVTLASEQPKARGICVDISPEALRVAEKNATDLGVADRVRCVESDWFSNVDGTYDLIVSNPPYVRTSDILGLVPDVRCFDPIIALDGGLLGLDCYVAIASQARRFLLTKGQIIVEAGAGQMHEVVRIFAKHGFKHLKSKRDLSGIERALAFSVDGA
jgi:release factor glutamine methyltransferase